MPKKSSSKRTRRVLIRRSDNRVQFYNVKVSNLKNYDKVGKVGNRNIYIKETPARKQKKKLIEDIVKGKPEFIRSLLQIAFKVNPARKYPDFKIRIWINSDKPVPAIELQMKLSQLQRKEPLLFPKGLFSTIKKSKVELGYEIEEISEGEADNFNQYQYFIKLESGQSDGIL